MPANVEELAQSSQEIGFHLLQAMTTNSQVLPPLWQLAVNVVQLNTQPIANTAPSKAVFAFPVMTDDHSGGFAPALR